MNDIALYTPPEQERGHLLLDPAAFEHGMKVATFLAQSQLVPQQFRNKPADVLVALNLARRMGEDPLTILQVVHVVNGKPGWAASFIIARINGSGLFAGPLEFETTGAGADMAVTCRAERSGKPCSATVSMRMAQAEGWTSNKKYQSMPEQMLRYRSATFFARTYCPGVLYGLPTQDENEDVEAASNGGGYTPGPRGVDAIDAVIDPDPEPVKVQGSAPNKGKPKPSPELDAQVLRQILGEAPEGTSLSFDIVRERFRAATGLARVSQDRWDAAIDYGRERGWLVYALDQEGLMLGDVREADPLPPEPTPKPERASVDLMHIIAAFEADLDDEAVNEAAVAAGLPLRDGEPYLDGAPVEALERYRAELERRVQL